MTGQSDTNLATLEAIEDDDMEADYIQEIEGVLLEAKPDNEDKNIDNEGKAFKRQPRKKTSTIWDHIITIKRNDATLKNQCNYCKDLLAYNASGITTHLWRHLKRCLQKQIADGEPDKKKQQILAFAEIDKEGVSSISNFSYDHAKVRELASHMVLAHEYPFEMMEHIVFNKFLKAISPFYQKISCYIVKKDCMTPYENEKKRLKMVLKNVSRVSITTDLWNSGQKIQYMVITGHFIDSNWMLHKCVLNFVNVPPPHTGVIVADALNKCLTEWGIENKVATVTVDNAIMMCALGD